MGIMISAARTWLLRSPKPFRFTNEFTDVLEYQTIELLGLYVHIPFCKQLCAFCPYCKQLYCPETAARYVSALLREIDLVCASQKEKKTVSSLYFGGGSPALLSDDLARILCKLQQHFNITDGIGVELHPEDVTISTLTKLKKMGVTRISIGIQSFQEPILHMLGRRSLDHRQIFTAIQTVPFDTVAMDFIFALENQSFAGVKADIDTAFANGANHIALYPFIDFAFAQSGIKKMAKRKMKRLLYQVSAYCASQGYVRDSIWTFGRPGVDKYSSMTRNNFLGFGCSATSLLLTQFKINSFSLEAYTSRIDSHTLPTALTIRFTWRQRMIYWLFWNFYTTRVNSAAFAATFGVSLRKMYGLELLLGRVLGLLTKEGSTYCLTSRGVFYYHYFEGFYTLAYIDRMWNTMKDIPFPDKLIL